MPDLNAYSASVPDWGKIRNYARRVARETKLALEPPITYLTTVSGPAEPARGGLFGGLKTPRAAPSVTKTITVVGPHWLLAARDHHILRTSGGRESVTDETTHEYFYFALTPDGDLVRAYQQVDEVITRFPSRPSASPYFVRSLEHSVRDLDSTDLATFDLEKYRFDSSGRNGKNCAWGDREPGRRLLRHAKGIGLSLALRNVLEGRRAPS